MANTRLDSYTLRGAALDDVPALVAVANRASRAETGADVTAIEKMSVEWQEPDFDPAADARVVLDPGGQVVGHVEVYTHPPYVRLHTWGSVDPAHQHRGIGTRLMAWAEQRARRFVAQAPPGARVTLDAHAVSTAGGPQALFRACGMRPVRTYSRMVIDLDGRPAAPQWPEGITVRTMRPGEERNVYAVIGAAFSDHWGHVDQPFEVAFQHWLHYVENEPGLDPALFFLAADGEQIVGVSLCRLNLPEDPDMGWVSTLGVLRSHRRRGIALALLRHSFAALHRRGQQRVGLGVDASSLTGATRLYEKAGMHVHQQRVLYEKELRCGADLVTRSLAD